MSAEKKLTNKELIRFRRQEMVKDLGLFEQHERTHTGTAVLRKMQAAGELKEPPKPRQRSATPEEILEMVLQTLILAGVEQLPLPEACCRTAARYGLAHNQVHSLKIEVRSYLQRVVGEVHVTDHGDPV